MKNEMPAPAPRSTFIRIADKKKVNALIKEAKRVGYTVEKSGDFSAKITDPDNAGALVLKAVNMGNCWSISYATAYWGEPEVILPATPTNFAATLHAHP